MANVTDPLVAALHGTDPQNLMEYITRQKIYDSRYWKEECFGLTAVQVLEKASTVKTIGGSYGGNMQPTKFISLILKLLQIQPSDDLIEEFIANEDFKYVRALGVFYKRLTGRPADIYELLEPLYRDYRKLRMRNVTEWSLVTMDELVHALLTGERVCGIALPRLAQRETLVEAGYLEEETRPTALKPMLEQYGGPEEYLLKKVEQGSVAAKELYEKRQQAMKEKREKQMTEKVVDNSYQGERDNRRRGDYYGRSLNDQMHGDYGDRQERRRDDRPIAEDRVRRGKRIDDRGYKVEREESKKKRLKKDQKYGTLFSRAEKRREKSPPPGRAEADMGASPQEDTGGNGPPAEGSKEYWNAERAKLGLKPLKE